VLAALIAFVPAVARAAAPSGEACGDTPGLRCLAVTVPLDRSGRVPGRVLLHVEVLPAQPARGALFLVAGGPGQGSADVFELGTPDYADELRELMPGYTLVAVDSRGTGRSGPLRCPMLEPLRLDDPGRATACAKRLGPRRDFYGTPDHAEDLEAVRARLGYRSIALFGVSYGTKLALSYALAHPGRVERLLLDSVSLPEGDDPFLAGYFAHFPKTLARFCGDGACRGVTADFPADVAALADDLAQRPIHGIAPRPDGGGKAERIGANDYLSLVVEADLNPAIAAELPAVTRAALHGNSGPLLRMYEVATGGAAGMYPTVNLALFLATTCRDGPFPWSPDTPLPARQQVVADGITELPAGALRPFGHWAATNGNARTCVGWPSPKGGAALGRGPLPDVPVLVLSGDHDLRTPTRDAATVAGRFRRGHLLVVPGSGHSVLGSDPTGCVESAIHGWLAGRSVRTRCTPFPAYLRPIAAFRDVSPPSTPRQTVAAVQRTVREAEATWLLAELGEVGRASGLRGGTLTAGGDSLTLAGYSLEPGVRVSGKLTVSDDGPPLTFTGVLTVRSADIAGTVTVRSSGRVEGILDGKAVAS